MCGIGGLIYKTATHRKKTGEVVSRMLESLYRRGPDSTGVVLLHAEEQGSMYVGVNYQKPGNGRKIISLLREICRVNDAADNGGYVRAQIQYSGCGKELVEQIERLAEDISVASIGSRLEVLKALGSVRRLEEQFPFSDYDGPIALGHTRMATESKVDISHSQPLSAHGFSDLTVIHNGHITNYVKLRSYYEKKGYTFITGNDSEVIAVYLADKLLQGADLKQAMEDSVHELDGSFTYLVLTSRAVGLAKEPFAMKPMVIAETDEFVALASEGQAISNGLGEELKVWEPSAEEVLVWEL